MRLFEAQPASFDRPTCFGSSPPPTGHASSVSCSILRGSFDACASENDSTAYKSTMKLIVV